MARCGQAAMGILLAAVLFYGSGTPVLWAQASNATVHNATQPLPVKAMQVKKINKQHQLAYPGVVFAKHQSTLSFRVPGMVEAIPVTTGQRMQKGQLVARLDSAHYHNAREQALAARRQANVRTQDAQAEYARLTKLASGRDISKQRLQSAQTTAKAAQETLHIAQQRLAEANRQLRHATLKAPFDGVVVSKQVHAFESVAAGEPVAVLVDPATLHFRAHLPANLRAEQAHFSTFTCEFPALNGLTLDAELHGIGPSAQPPLRTYSLEVNLPSVAKHPVMPGLEGILHITVSRDAAASQLRLPVSAIISDHSGAPHVWIANPKNGTAHKRSVQLGAVREGKMTVTSGITPGQWVITAGQHHLSPGQTIKIVTSQHGSD